MDSQDDRHKLDSVECTESRFPLDHTRTDRPSKPKHLLNRTNDSINNN